MAPHPPQQSTTHAIMPPALVSPVPSPPLAHTLPTPSDPSTWAPHHDHVPRPVAPPGSAGSVAAHPPPGQPGAGAQPLPHAWPACGTVPPGALLQLVPAAAFSSIAGVAGSVPAAPAQPPGAVTPATPQRDVRPPASPARQMLPGVQLPQMFAAPSLPLQDQAAVASVPPPQPPSFHGTSAGPPPAATAADASISPIDAVMSHFQGPSMQALAALDIPCPTTQEEMLMLQQLQRNLDDVQTRLTREQDATVAHLENLVQDMLVRTVEHVLGLHACAWCTPGLHLVYTWFNRRGFTQKGIVCQCLRPATRIVRGSLQTGAHCWEDLA